jgi:hypothetical protein
MHGNHATVEPHRADQVTAAPGRRFASLPYFLNKMHPNLRKKRPLDEFPKPLSISGTSHFLVYTGARIHIQDSSQRNFSAAFLSIPSLAIKLLQMEPLHQIQTDKYED